MYFNYKSERYAYTNLLGAYINKLLSWPWNFHVIQKYGVVSKGPSTGLRPNSLGYISRHHILFLQDQF
jgi:hypothetical protein